MHKTRSTTAIVAALFAAAIFAGCTPQDKAATEPTGGATASTPAPEATTPTEAAATTLVSFKDGEGKLQCPVMGTTVASEEKAVGYSDFEGTRYYFCCDDCKPLFDKDPAKFAEGKAIKSGQTVKDDHGHSEHDGHGH